MVRQSSGASMALCGKVRVEVKLFSDVLGGRSEN